jgi:hypothetical protein
MASTSPSKIAVSAAASRRTAPAMSGRLAVISCSRREKMRTVSPCLWICTRAPSSFHSNTRRPSSACQAAATSEADWASIGFSG